MNARSLFLPVLVLFLALIAAGAAIAQDSTQPNPDETGRIYLGNELTLVSFKPRLLTANAGVSEFLYSPTGTRIAYITQDQQGAGNQQVTQTSLEIVAVQSGDTKTYASGTMESSDQTPSDAVQIENLCGWSDDSAYLAFREMRTAQDGPAAIEQLEYVDLVHGTVLEVPFPPAVLTAPPSSDNTTSTPAGSDQADQSMPSGTLQFADMLYAAWAPGANLLAFTTYADFSGGGHTHAICLFDPSSKSTRVLVNDSRFLSLVGWLDTSHLLYRAGKDRFIYDLGANSAVPAPAAKPQLARMAVPQAGALTDVSAPSNQELVISADEQPVTAEAQTYGDATAIWVQRKGGPKAMSRLLLDIFRGSAGMAWSSNADPRAQFAPNGGFDREGRYQVAYIAQGDLKVCDLSVRSATLMEQAMGGVKLPCDQEQLLALQNAKQLGLAILQYAQDFDEHFPSGAGFAAGVAPYLPQDVPIDLPNIAPFQYTPPADLSLSAAQDPADTALGEYSLPCGTITLYMDGHVKVIPPDAPAGTQN